MVLKSSNNHIAGIALLRDLEEQYGSVTNVPDDNKQLIEIRKMFDRGTAKDRPAVIPLLVLKDEHTKATVTGKTQYEKAYETMLRENLNRSQACQDTGTNKNSFCSFLNNLHAYTEYCEMDFKGRVIRGRTANDVLNEAKKYGFYYRADNAVENHDMHRRIILKPLVFKEPSALKSR